MKIKQFLSIFILMTIIMSVAAEGFAISSDEKTNLITTSAERRVEKLLRIGAIYNDAEYTELTRNIKRGEFAKILVKFIGYSDMLPIKVTMKPLNSLLYL